MTAELTPDLNRALNGQGDKRLGRKLAEHGTLASLLPVMEAKDLDLKQPVNFPRTRINISEARRVLI